MHYPFLAGVADGDEVKHLRARVRHVDGDIEKILKEEKRTKSGAHRLPTPCKRESQQKRHQKLHDSPTPHSDHPSKPAKEKMAALMRDQIYVIEPRVSAHRAEGVHQKQQIERRPANESRA